MILVKVACSMKVPALSAVTTTASGAYTDEEVQVGEFILHALRKV